MLVLGFSALSVFAGEKQIEMRVELYSVPQLEAIEMTNQTDASIDATELVKSIRALEKEGAVKLVTTATTISRSGRRAKVANGKEYSYISGYRVKDDREEPVQRTINNGTVFEVDSLIGADESTLDLNFALTYSNHEFEIKKQTMVGPVSGKELPFETVILDQAKITTSVTVKSGQTAMIGTVNQTGDSGKVLMAFLKADIRED